MSELRKYPPPLMKGGALCSLTHVSETPSILVHCGVHDGPDRSKQICFRVVIASDDLGDDPNSPRLDMYTQLINFR